MLFQTCTSFFLRLNTKEDIIYMFVTRQLTVVIVFLINCLATNILQNIFFSFDQKKKPIQVWNKLRVSK